MKKKITETALLAALALPVFSTASLKNIASDTITPKVPAPVQITSHHTLLQVTTPLKNLAWVDGGVSDGGGGTTNPHPADPYFISRVANEEAAPAILAWLNAQEDNFSRHSQAEKKTKAIRKLFDPAIDFRAIVRNTPVELRMGAPCQNVDGQDRDGSIYGSRPGAICISPFSIGPKVSEFNMAAETIALIVHELSHLVGADEAEAQEIQKDVLLSLSHVDFLSFKVDISLIAHGNGEISDSVFKHQMLKGKGARMKSYEVRNWSDALVRLRDAISLKYFLNLNYLTAHQNNLLTAKVITLGAIEDYLCSTDPNEDHVVSRYCAEKLEKGFQSDQSLSVRAYLKRLDDIDFDEKEFDDVVIRRPQSGADLDAGLNYVYETLIEIWDTFKDLDTVKLKTYN